MKAPGAGSAKATKPAVYAFPGWAVDWVATSVASVCVHAGASAPVQSSKPTSFVDVPSDP